MVVSLALCALMAAQDPTPEPDEIPVEAYFKDGLRFRTKDGHFEAHIGGRALATYGAILDRPDDETDPRRTVPGTAYLRQARLQMSGTLYRDWGFMVQGDFNSGTINQSTFGAGPSNATGILRHAFVEWKRLKEFQLRFGQFFEPVSQEDNTGLIFVDLAERSPMNRLLPGRDIGLQASGTLFGDMLTYAVMGCNGGSLLNHQGSSVVDREDGKEVAALVRVSPFRNTGNDLLKGLRLGIGGSAGSVDDVAADGFDLVSTELFVMWWESTAGTFDGRRTRLVPQIQWPIGPFNLQAEYLIRRDELADGSAESRLETSGFYVQASYILTGEDKKPEARVVPKGDWGAVELAFRFSRVSVENGVDAGLGAAVGNAEEITALTFGVNWWVVPNVRLTANVIAERYDEELFFDTREEDSLVGLLLRGQVDF